MKTVDRSIEEMLSRGEWMRDLAIVGAASALPAMFLSAPGYTPSSDFVVLLCVFASAGAALIGLAIPTLLQRRIRRMPLLLIAPAAMCVGELWGGGSALLASAIAREPIVWMTTLGAIVGALVLGTFWLPYALLRAHGRSAHGVVIGACATAPLFGWLGSFVLTGW
jgi:hypothetical protein